MKQGKLIVIDGIDGSGKATQIELLSKDLTSKNIPFEVIDFPRYEDNIYGRLIKRYLEGEFGDITQVNPYLMALAFAGDRFLAKPLIENWLKEGKIVIANRYVSASKAHLGANLLPDKQSLRHNGLKRDEFLKWIDWLEYQTNAVPREVLTILLYVDPVVGQRNAESRDRFDIHEENLEHLKEASELYLRLAKNKSNWYTINCTKEDEMKGKEEIHQEVLKIVKKII